MWLNFLDEKLKIFYFALVFIQFDIREIFFKNVVQKLHLENYNKSYRTIRFPDKNREV